MKRLREEPQACNNGNITFSHGEVPRLNLVLRKTPELIKKVEDIIKQYSTQKDEKQKAINFEISNITIGEWSRNKVYADELKAKFYFAKKKLIWETLDFVTTEPTKQSRLKKKIEINWSDILSFKLCNETGVFRVELKKPPTFHIETNSKPLKHTQWQLLDQDFTLNKSASRYRIHTLYFASEDLQKIMDKLMSADSFWSKLYSVHFPISQDLYFDIDYGNNRQVISFGQGNSQSNNVNQLLVPQVNQPQPADLFTEVYNKREGFGESQFDDHTLLDSQAYSYVFPNMYETLMDHQFRPYNEGFLAQEAVDHNIEHTLFDGNLVQEGVRDDMEHTQLAQRRSESEQETHTV